MTKTYVQILQQIETLKAEANKVRRKEVDGVIARIREAIDHYGLSAADLGLAARAVAGPKAAPKKGRRGAVKAVKFRDEAGNSWVGRGKRPQWLRDALAGGKTLQDFEVR